MDSSQIYHKCRNVLRQQIADIRSGDATLKTSPIYVTVSNIIKQQINNLSGTADAAQSLLDASFATSTPDGAEYPLLGLTEHYHSLAYVEQIPRDSAIYILGLGDMAKWTLRLLRLRGYDAVGFIADGEYSGTTLMAKSVIMRKCFHSWHFGPQPLTILVASPHRDSLLPDFIKYRHSPNNRIFDVTRLYEFVTNFAHNDTDDILLDDLGLTYWRSTTEEARHAGAVWRHVKKQSADTYVRNIENVVGPGSRCVVNIGSHDGISGDPCYPLFRDGWRGWAVDSRDADSEVGLAAQRNLDLPGVSLSLGTFVTSKNIAGLLYEHGASTDCDLIKIDIDSFDGAVIEAMLTGGWAPRVFCIEINACFPPPFTFKLPEQDLNGPRRIMDYEFFVSLGLYGCSAAWAAKIFEKHGFTFSQYEFGFPTLIGGIRDMIFIRNDVFDASGAVRLDWRDAYYAEPLGWSHIRSGIKLDPRDWRYERNPHALVRSMRETLMNRWKEKIGRTADIDFELDIYAPDA
jgi:hypothetical protein